MLQLVDRFGSLMNKPHQVEEVLSLLNNIPDAKTFEMLRNAFYSVYKHPFLPTFLDGLNETDHIKLLQAFKQKSSDYA